MSGFVEQLRLAEKAAEDIYFAKVDRELIESLHKRMQAEKNSFQPADPAPKHGRMDSPVVTKETSGG
jgi:hypothetical protein